MSGQPNRKPADSDKFRAEYMQSLGLMADINEMNHEANKTYLATGQLPAVSQMAETRTTSEILADREKLKESLIKDLSPLGAANFALSIIQRIEKSPLNLDGSLFIFFAQRAPEIVKNLQREYKYGIKGDSNDMETFVSFVEDMYSKTKSMSSSVKSYFNRPLDNSRVGNLTYADLSRFAELYKDIVKRLLLKIPKKADYSTPGEYLGERLGVEIRGPPPESKFDKFKEKVMDISYKIDSNLKLLSNEEYMKSVELLLESQNAKYYGTSLMGKTPLPDLFYDLFKRYNDAVEEMPRYDVLFAMTQQLDKSMINKNWDLTFRILDEIDSQITPVDDLKALSREIDDLRQAYRTQERLVATNPEILGFPSEEELNSQQEEEERNRMAKFPNVVARTLARFPDVEGTIPPEVTENISGLAESIEPSMESKIEQFGRRNERIEKNKREIESKMDVLIEEEDEIDDNIETRERVIESSKRILAQIEPEITTLRAKGGKTKKEKKRLVELDERYKQETQIITETEQKIKSDRERKKVISKQLDKLIEKQEKLEKESVNKPTNYPSYSLYKEPSKKDYEAELKRGREYARMQKEEGLSAEELRERKASMGHGLKKRRGRPKGSGINPHKTYKEIVKAHTAIDKGIDQTPRFVKFGRYLINTQKLNEDTLAIKQPSGGNIMGFPSTRISKNMSHVIKKMIGNGMPTYSELSKLSEPEKAYLHKISSKANIIDKFSIPAPDKDREEKDIHDFEVMKGEIMAGNDSKELIKKFKLHLIRLSKNNTLPKKEVQEVMEELISLGY